MSYVVLARPEKKLMMACQVLYKGMVDHNIPDMGFQGHTLQSVQAVLLLVFGCS